MRVVLFSQHFLLEVTAARFRAEAFARELIGRGHDLKVICPVPNHPQGVVRPEFRGHLVQRRQIDGIVVEYVWVKASVAKTTLSRVAYYGSYAAMALALGVRGPRPDVILATSPPLPVAMSAAAVARRHGAKWVFDVRDIWPDVAMALGELPPGMPARAIARIESVLLRDAAAITTVTEPFANNMAAKLGGDRKISVIPNGTTRAWMQAGEKASVNSRPTRDGERFVWIYAGNLGLSHGLERAVEAAALLNDDFQLLIMGDGPQRDALEKQAADLPAGRVAFLSLQEPAEAARTMSAADALLVIQRDDLKDVVSSKLYDCCALGRPILSVAAGEMNRLVKASDAAMVVEGSDPARIAAAVRKLRDEPSLGSRLAANARAFAAAHLREDQASEMATLLEAVGSGTEPYALKGRGR